MLRGVRKGLLAFLEVPFPGQQLRDQLSMSAFNSFPGLKNGTRFGGT